MHTRKGNISGCGGHLKKKKNTATLQINTGISINYVTFLLASLRKLVQFLLKKKKKGCSSDTVTLLHSMKKLLLYPHMHLKLITKYFAYPILKDFQHHIFPFVKIMVLSKSNDI